LGHRKATTERDVVSSRVRFRRKAKEDILAAGRYYKSKGTSLGPQFLERVDHVIQLIRDHPRMFPVSIGPFRRALLKQFPYALYYEIVGGTILVAAVLHQHRNIKSVEDVQ
jgi:plasmid stabilization system protein ParE